jgi:hypothetical protein
MIFLVCKALFPEVNTDVILPSAHRIRPCFLLIAYNASVIIFIDYFIQWISLIALKLNKLSQEKFYIILLVTVLTLFVSSGFIYLSIDPELNLFWFLHHFSISISIGLSSLCLSTQAKQVKLRELTMAANTSCMLAAILLQRIAVMVNTG